jgi:hypothetical protein
MQVDRTAEPTRLGGSVRGLGVCDVLRVELEPVQRAGFETGLAARVAELERSHAALQHTAAGEQLAEVSAALRLLARIRAALPRQAAAPWRVIGPAGLLLELVDACVADAVARLADRMGERYGGPPRYASLSAEFEAAAAWIATALDCAAVDGFCFEPGADPDGAW